MKKFFDEEQLEKFKLNFVMGTDEVGRGPLAGPVVSCTVLIEEQGDSLNSFLQTLAEFGVGDSKKLTSKKRAKLLDLLEINLTEVNPGTVYSKKNVEKKWHFVISEIDSKTIDQINILQASLLSMAKATELQMQNLEFHDWKKTLLLVDGNQKFQWSKTEMDRPLMQTVIGGDAKSLVIGLASVIAKEYRDRLMAKYGELYPGYGLESHAGYGTESHRQAIERLGVTPIHRRSFKGVKEYVEISRGIVF